MQARALARRQPLDLHRVARWGAMRDILDLLSEDQIEKRRLRVEQRVQIGFCAEAERLQARNARGCRALYDVVADRERARCRDDAEQAGFLQIDAALLGLEAAEPVERGRNRTGGFGEQLGKGRLTGRAVEGLAPQRVGEVRVPLHGAQIEEDIDREQVLWV